MRPHQCHASESWYPEKNTGKIRMFKSIKILFLWLALIFISLTCYADLAAIQQHGYIRVGITGDYPPFSWYDIKTKQYSGFDIDLAQNLADYLNVKLHLEKTTWLTLSKDLQQNKFDIAMGGISVTPERQKEFIFSAPIVFDQKIALIRCEDEKKYTQLVDIDRPEVTVIENKGGANEVFAKTHLQHAKLLLIRNNPEVFNYLADHKADVMFTDSAEAKYQRKQHPQLCVLALGRTISPMEPKAIMLRKDDVQLQNKINEWLKRLQKSGKLQELTNKWLS